MAQVDPSQIDAGAAAREIIFTADLLLRVDDVDAAVLAATAIAQEHGGQVFSSDVSGRQDRRALLELRVPPDELSATLEDLGELGRVEASSLSAEDVTLQVVDVESRIASAEATIARLRELLDEATILTDVVALETELANREADLEALQAQLRVLREQIDLSSVTVQLVGPDAPISVDPDIPGFGSGLRNGLAALVNVLKVLLASLGFLLPFAVVFGALAYAARWAWRAYRRRRPPKPAHPAPRLRQAPCTAPTATAGNPPRSRDRALPPTRTRRPRRRSPPRDGAGAGDRRLRRVRRLARGGADDLVDQAVGDGVVAAEDVVALDVGGDALDGLAGGLAEDLLDALAGEGHLLVGDADVGRLALGAAVGLVDQHARVGQGRALAVACPRPAARRPTTRPARRRRCARRTTAPASRRGSRTRR